MLHYIPMSCHLFAIFYMEQCGESKKNLFLFLTSTVYEWIGIRHTINIVSLSDVKSIDFIGMIRDERDNSFCASCTTIGLCRHSKQTQWLTERHPSPDNIQSKVIEIFNSKRSSIHHQNELR